MGEVGLGRRMGDEAWGTDVAAREVVVRGRDAAQDELREGDRSRGRGVRAKVWWTVVHALEGGSNHHLFSVKTLVSAKYGGGWCGRIRGGELLLGILATIEVLVGHGGDTAGALQVPRLRKSNIMRYLMLERKESVVNRSRASNAMR